MVRHHANIRKSYQNSKPANPKNDTRFPKTKTKQNTLLIFTHFKLKYLNSYLTKDKISGNINTKSTI